MKLLIIVDLAVEADQIATASAPHRLVAGGAQVEYRESAVAQGYGAIDFDTPVIRPAALERIGHRLDDRTIIAIVPNSEDTGNSTHDATS
jgi:hypothetical protein